MENRQHVGRLRLLAIVALFLGLVSMHHLALAHCDDIGQISASATISHTAGHEAMTMQTHPSHSVLSDNTQSNLLLGCACVMALCLAIITLLFLLRPRVLKTILRVRELRPHFIARILQLRLPEPPDLFALSVART